MANTAEHLAALLELPSDERIEIANALLDSVEEEEPGWENAWAAELARRVEGLRDGSRQPIDSETARGRIIERLRAFRR